MRLNGLLASGMLLQRIRAIHLVLGASGLPKSLERIRQNWTDRCPHPSLENPLNKSDQEVSLAQIRSQKTPAQIWENTVAQIRFTLLNDLYLLLIISRGSPFFKIREHPLAQIRFPPVESVP